MIYLNASQCGDCVSEVFEYPCLSRGWIIDGEREEFGEVCKVSKAGEPLYQLARLNSGLEWEERSLLVTLIIMAEMRSG